MDNIQLERYSRNICMPNIGEKGQEKLLASKVLVIGAGGLGSPVLLYLAAAGVGTLGIVDSDSVETSNLQRQVIHSTTNISKAKAISAQERITDLNPDIKTIIYNQRFTEQNADEMIQQYDFIVDATDNFSSKFLINDVCVKHKKAFSHGGILRFAGQCITYSGESACLRCVFDDAPPSEAIISPAQAGVLGAAVGIIGSIQATETIKFLLRTGELLTNKLLTVNALSMEFSLLQLSNNPNCICSKNHV